MDEPATETEKATTSAEARCYLCGELLDSQPSDNDHVPPLQIYAKSVRREHNLNLRTIRVHRRCNNAFNLDEEYFVQTLLPFARDSYSGKAKLTETIQKFHGGDKVKLVRTVLNEFERRPSGIILPPGVVVKRFQGDRVSRVAMKIVRGLHFFHTGEVIPADVRETVSIYPPGTPPPNYFQLLGEGDGLGQYPGVFDYKSRVFPDVNNLHFWALLLWDKIIVLCLFQHPAENEQDSGTTLPTP